MIPNAPKQPNDLIDLIFESVQRIKERTDENGNPTLSLEADNKSLFLRTLLIPNPNFGGCVLEVEKWEGLMNSAKDNMCSEVASVIYQQGMAIAEGYYYAFASKSSETVRDKNNTMSSLSHLVQRNHMEKTVTLKEEAKKSALAFMGVGGDRDDHQPQY